MYYLLKSEIGQGFISRKQFEKVNKQVPAYDFYFLQETADHRDLSRDNPLRLPRLCF